MVELVSYQMLFVHGGIGGNIQSMVYYYLPWLGVQ